MTVLELIAELKQMPETATVVTDVSDGVINRVVLGSEYLGYDDSVVFLEVW